MHKHVLALISIILFSGCIQAETGNGLIIQEFEPDLPEEFSGEVVTFFVSIKNTGSQTATGVRAELLGLDQDWFNNGEPVGNGPWSSGDEKLPEEEQCRFTSGGFDLIPPDPQYGTEGAGFTCTWKYKAPKLPLANQITYTPSVRLYYVYQSETVKNVNILPRDQLRLLIDSGSPLPSETLSQSRSPISLNVETPGPVRASQETVTFPLRVTLNNIDPGMACFPADIRDCKLSGTNWNKVAVSVGLPDNMELLDCSEIMIIDLFRGDSNSFTCIVQASGIDLTIPNTGAIIVSANYMYMLDKTTTIKVSGKQTL